MRASDADRERVVEVLQRGAAAGYLSMNTLSHRTEHAYRAQTRRDLESTLTDLPMKTEFVFDGVAPTSIRNPGLWLARLLLPKRVILAAPPMADGDGPAGLLIGRAKDCSFVLSGRSVSRHHARLSYRASVWVVQDLESTNGTWVNGKRISSATVGPSDEVVFGAVACRFVV